MSQGVRTAAQAAKDVVVFKALANPVRLQIVSFVAASAEGQVSAGQIVERFSLSQPTISHHLRVLREAGVLTTYKTSTFVYYRFAPQLRETVAGVLPNAAAAKPPATAAPARKSAPRTATKAAAKSTAKAPAKKAPATKTAAKSAAARATAKTTAKSTAKSTKSAAKAAGATPAAKTTSAATKAPKSTTAAKPASAKKVDSDVKPDKSEKSEKSDKKGKKAKKGKKGKKK